jgi:hypothetical protein
MSRRFSAVNSEALLDAFALTPLSTPARAINRNYFSGEFVNAIYRGVLMHTITATPIDPAISTQ